MKGKCREGEKNDRGTTEEYLFIVSFFPSSPQTREGLRENRRSKEEGEGRRRSSLELHKHELN